MRISVYVCSEDNWTNDPRQYGASVHVFVNEGKPLEYVRYDTYNKRSKLFKSDTIQANIASAEA